MTLQLKTIPTIENVKELLKDNSELIFEIDQQTIGNDYMTELQNEFKNHVVTKTKLLNRIIISPSISTKIVLDNLIELHDAIDLFDKTAHLLMNLMAQTYEIDLNKNGQLHELKYDKSKNQRGIINNEWEYFFHGKGCSFTNINTKQFLDIQLSYKTEFGALDTYYLMKFIESTDSLKSLKSILNSDVRNMQKVIEVFLNLNYLVEIQDGIKNIIIINRNKKPVANNGYK